MSDKHGELCESFRAEWYPPVQTEFYGILVEGGSMPTVWHESLKIAEKEAKRLVIKENKICTILKKVCEVRPIDKFTINYFN